MRSAMLTARQLSRNRPTDVDDVTAPAHKDDDDNDDGNDDDDTQDNFHLLSTLLFQGLLAQRRIVTHSAEPHEATQ